MIDKRKFGEMSVLEIVQRFNELETMYEPDLDDSAEYYVTSEQSMLQHELTWRGVAWDYCHETDYKLVILDGSLGAHSNLTSHGDRVD